MNFEEAIRDGFEKYAQFNGRSSRSAYWWFALFAALVYVGASIIDAVINTPIFFLLALLGLFLPTLAVLVRRLHDTDRSGWWFFISFVPFVGSIVLIVFACTDSAPPNKWGNGPDGKGDMTMTSPFGMQVPPPPPPSTPPPAAPGPPPSPMAPPDQSERAPD